MIAYSLFGTFLFLAIAAYFFSNQDLFSPAVLFTAPFAVASLNLLFNISRWDVKLNFVTYLVIICGTLCFLLGCAIVSVTNQQRQRCVAARGNVLEPLTEMNMSPTILSLWIIFQTISFVICVQATSSIARRNGYGGTIFEQIGGYKYLGTHTTVSVSLGTVPNILYSICCNAGYIWFYVLIRNYFATKKINKLLLINLLFSAVFDLSKGGRQSVIQLLTAGVFFYFYFFKKANVRKKLPLKTVLLFATAAILVVSTFQLLGGVLGRKSGADFNHYIAIYLSAPIRNLDAYLKNPHNEADIFGQMTFIRFINYLGNKVHVDQWIYPLDLPYLYANGKSCGNVYTTFYAYIYDFGYMGVCVMPFLMGFISQNIYNRCTKKTKSVFAALVYGYLAYQIAFSFFSNKFYEALVSPVIMSKLRDWFLVLLSTRIRLRIGRVRLK